VSSQQYKTLKGMQDILPPDIVLWQKVEQTARQIFSVYGFQEIRTPIMESTTVFSRSIGESTDIVEKEMYTFTDKGDRTVSLRPEGTASVVRSYVENHLDKLPAPQKFYYLGPMFRYERPQSGRFRQFYQIGVEAFADHSPRMDAEVIAMLERLLSGIGLEGISFQINSIGCEQCRPGHRDALLAFFSDKKEHLCDDCKRRYDKNPLRILDCKASACRQLRQGAPKITDHLCEGCRSHFEKLQELLSLLQVPYSLNADMVRGLDYYTRTTFEVTSQSLGAQNAVAAGGRYDRLVKEFGGPETPAIGFALGMERVIELLKKTTLQMLPAPSVFFAVLGDAAGSACLVLAEQLRRQGLWVEVGDATSSLKSQMRRADRMAVRHVFIMGDDELHLGILKWKNLAEAGQGELRISDIGLFLAGQS
jgi:histidyl-tRNA synthetase